MCYLNGPRRPIGGTQVRPARINVISVVSAHLVCWRDCASSVRPEEFRLATVPHPIAVSGVYIAASGQEAKVRGKHRGRKIDSAAGGRPGVGCGAIGSAEVVQLALRSLRPRGRHVQVGLLPAEVSLDLTVLIAGELQWLGSHGMPAHDYRQMLELVNSGAVRPDELVTRVIGLDDVPDALAAMNTASTPGVTVIRPWA